MLKELHLAVTSEWTSLSRITLSWNLCAVSRLKQQDSSGTLKHMGAWC